MTEPIETVATEKPNVTSLVPVQTSGSLVRPAAPLADVQHAFGEYQGLCTALLDSTDFQRIGDKDFKKKSAWRKLAVAFGVSTHMVERNYERDERGRIVRAEVVVRAVAPNGRSEDGIGACDLFEKCCDPKWCKITYRKHRHCDPGCPGSIHFSNPQHDLPATAHTRAKNRACADLFGMGEVSAEEMTDKHVDHDDWWGGWSDEAAMKAELDPLWQRARSLGDEAKARLRALVVDEMGYERVPCALRRPDVEKVATLVAELERPAEAPPADDSLTADEQAIVARVTEMAMEDVKAELKERGFAGRGNDAGLRKRLAEELLSEASRQSTPEPAPAAGVMDTYAQQYGPGEEPFD